MTVLCLNPCCNKVCNKWTALNMVKEYLKKDLGIEF